MKKGFRFGFFLAAVACLSLSTITLAQSSRDEASRLRVPYQGPVITPDEFIARSGLVDASKRPPSTSSEYSYVYDDASQAIYRLADTDGNGEADEIFRFFWFKNGDAQIVAMKPVADRLFAVTLENDLLEFQITTAGTGVLVMHKALGLYAYTVYAERLPGTNQFLVMVGGAFTPGQDKPVVETFLVGPHSVMSPTKAPPAGCTSTSLVSFHGHLYSVDFQCGNIYEVSPRAKLKNAELYKWDAKTTFISADSDGSPFQMAANRQSLFVLKHDRDGGVSLVSYGTSGDGLQSVQLGTMKIAGMDLSFGGLAATETMVEMLPPSGGSIIGVSLVGGGAFGEVKPFFVAPAGSKLSGLGSE